MIVNSRHLFLIISLVALSATAHGQVRQRESSWDQEWLRKIRNGQPNADFKVDTLHQFERNKGFSEGLAYVVVKGKWGFINRAGDIIIKPQFDDAGCFRNGLAPVERNGKWGYIDRTGKLVVDFVWDWGFEFYEERALVMLAGRWGYIDASGKDVIKPQFDVANSFSEGLALVGLRTERTKAIEHYDWGYVDRSGKWIIKQGVDPRYHPVGDFNDGLAHVHILLGYHSTGDVMVEDGYIDKTGKVVMKPVIKGQATDFYEGLAQIRVSAGGEEWYGFLNRNGQVVIEPKFENAWHFSEGLAQIAQGKKWGFADKQGTMIIGPQFDAVRYFADGLAAFEVNGKWGFIDKSGRVIINPRFDRAWNYSEGAVLIAVGDQVGYVDKAGNYIWPPSK